jgi:hypothetical protein
MIKGSSLWPALLLGAGLLAASTNGLAAMYKWTDSEGNVQYSQSPPPQGNFQKMAPPPPAPPVPEAAPVTTEPAADAAADAEAEAAKEAAEQKKREAAVAKENCEVARKNAEIYTAFRRVMNEKGEIVVLGDDERAAKLKEANDMIKKYCK